VLTQRPPDLARDRDLLLELHALGNDESDTPHARADGFEAYRAR